MALIALAVLQHQEAEDQNLLPAAA